MESHEVFPNPTVKQVIFQIRFPNLFFLENKIGDFQLRIMREFPDSSLMYRKQLFFAEVGEGVTVDELANENESTTKRIWQFKSPNNYELNVLNDSLDISSKFHKTYNSGDGIKFRDIIQFVVNHFLEVTSLPIISRIGLRYIDICPIPEKNTEVFQSYYNTTFPLTRFNITDAEEMEFKTVYRYGDCKLRYMEMLKQENGKYDLILDFDSYMSNIDADNYLDITDNMHTIISNEFYKTIREPVYRYMRGE